MGLCDAVHPRGASVCTSHPNAPDDLMHTYPPPPRPPDGWARNRHLPVMAHPSMRWRLIGRRSGSVFGSCTDSVEWVRPLKMVLCVC